MIQKIKNQLLVAVTLLALFVPTVGVTATVGAVAAGCTGISGGVAEGANSAINADGSQAGGLSGGGGVNCQATGVDDNSLKKLAARITNTFSIIVGAASVIMIIYGGFRYITSGGESGRVGAAKNALLYAIIGLVIVAIAQLIVHFVLAQASQL